MITIIIRDMYDIGFLRFLNDIGIEVEQIDSDILSIFNHLIPRKETVNWESFNCYHMSEENMNLFLLAGGGPLWKVGDIQSVRLYGLMTGLHLGIDPGIVY